MSATANASPGAPHTSILSPPPTTISPSPRVTYESLLDRFRKAWRDTADKYPGPGNACRVTEVQAQLQRGMSKCTEAISGKDGLPSPAELKARVIRNINAVNQKWDMTLKAGSTPVTPKGKDAVQVNGKGKGKGKNRAAVEGDARKGKSTPKGGKHAQPAGFTNEETLSVHISEALKSLNREKQGFLAGTDERSKTCFQILGVYDEAVEEVFEVKDIAAAWNVIERTRSVVEKLREQYSQAVTDEGQAASSASIVQTLMAQKTKFIEEKGVDRKSKFGKEVAKVFDDAIKKAQNARRSVFPLLMKHVQEEVKKLDQKYGSSTQLGGVEFIRAQAMKKDSVERETSSNLIKRERQASPAPAEKSAKRSKTSHGLNDMSEDLEGVSFSQVGDHEKSNDTPNSVVQAPNNPATPNTVAATPPFAFQAHIPTPPFIDPAAEPKVTFQQGVQWACGALEDILKSSPNEISEGMMAQLEKLKQQVADPTVHSASTHAPLGLTPNEHERSITEVIPKLTRDCEELAAKEAENHSKEVRLGPSLLKPKASRVIHGLSPDIENPTPLQTQETVYEGTLQHLSIKESRTIVSEERLANHNGIEATPMEVEQGPVDLGQGTQQGPKDTENRNDELVRALEDAFNEDEDVNQVSGTGETGMADTPIEIPEDIDSDALLNSP
ncbi:hypothetical protein BCR34DRAFT_665427 [Clohesyomyces aquaticus]|uniref:Uncharacterized protein n=1 Tax=Clohesyomyces aquaticus TaxID=1231657 RepID=A0A1Y1ZH55_9PLEO|nr:hypothetical protein BCR34DRAFT_665427 [Clohesyomyces aquaticus]